MYWYIRGVRGDLLLHPRGYVTYVAILLILTGPAFGYLALNNYLQRRASVHWPSVNATVSRAEARTSHARILAHVEYTYQVGGSNFVGTYQSPGNQQEVQQTLDGFVIGKSIKVFYDPKDPAESLLTTGVTHGTVVACVASFLPMVFGIFLLLMRRYIWPTLKLSPPVPHSTGMLR